MCNYCGCRDFPLVALLTEQHDAIEEQAGELRRAILGGREADASRRLEALVGLLGPHTTTEERGLFAELRAEGSLTEAVERLCGEHVDIHGVLGAVDRAAPDWPTVLAALERLHRHIDNEEHGLFPAAVNDLPIPAWDRITPSRVAMTAQLDASEP
jgi:hemerythrin-like domain-containing protein